MQKISLWLSLKILIRYKLVRKFKDFYRYYGFVLINSRFVELSKNSKKGNDSVDKSSVVAIIFSKDRAMQLHSLLESFFDNKIGDCGVVVIYSASSTIHKESYRVLIENHKENILFLNQELFDSFQDCLQSALNNLAEDKVFFLVDDIIFTETVDYDYLSNIDLTNTVFSLRMGGHLKHSYVVDLPQPLPQNICLQKNFIFWDWSDGVMEWGYPLSLDGHFFPKKDVVRWCNFLKFRNPSSFEIELQKLNFVYKKKQGMAYSKSRIVNVPINVVQNEVSNIHGFLHQDQLVAYWMDGMAIDVKKFKSLVNLSTHQEYGFEYVKRDAK